MIKTVSIQDKRRWLANAELALALWRERVKPEQVVKDLGFYRCSTQACFGGWLATWPEFQAQGVRPMETSGNQHDNGMPWIDAHPLPICGVSVAEDLFGNGSLFAARHHRIDPSETSELNDWQVVELRLLKRIASLQDDIGSDATMELHP